MAFQRPSLADLISRTTADLVSRLELQSEVLRRAVVRVLAKVYAGAVHGLHGHLDWNARQLFASTADAAELDSHGLDFGISRRTGAFATGNVRFTGADDAPIPAGLALQRPGGAEFITLTGGVIAGGQALLPVKASAAGTDSNTETGAALTLISPLPAVFSTANVAAGGISNGLDTESDASYRARILQRKRQSPQGGSKADYLLWATEVPGVTRAWVYPAWIGIGTVGVTFVLDESPNIIPDAGKVAEVAAYIEARRPVTAKDVIVFAPVPVAINFSIDLVPDTTAVRAAVAAELADLLRRQGAPGTTLAISQIREAISVSAGEQSHMLTVPTADVVLANNQLPIMGVITWL